MLPAYSRCPSAAGFASRPSFPAWYSAPLAIGLPPGGHLPPADHDGVSTFRTHEIRPDRRPLYPGTSGARTGHQLPWPAACRLSTARVLSPGAAVIYPGFDLTRRRRGFKRFARPAFPSPAPPGRHGDRSGFFPGLRTRTGRTRARTPSGQALSTSPKLRRRSAWTSPPICAPTHCERPRVAPIEDRLPSRKACKPFPGLTRPTYACALG